MVAQPVCEVLEGRRLWAGVPAGFIDEAVVTGLGSPTAMAFAPDGRLFVAEQGGRIVVARPEGGGGVTVFGTVGTEVAGERGLIGIALDPQFAANGFVYVYYTVPGAGVHNRVARLTARGDVMVAGSERVLMELDPLSSATNHNGGGMQFGADGKLYVGVGDNAQGANAQSMETVKGKILRMNADGSIPAGNPFYGATSGNNRAIYALGLRNPFTLGVGRDDGRIFVQDVGQNGVEEINVLAAGANYGWPMFEGPTANPGSTTNPVYSYTHAVGQSVVGGAFYPKAGGAFPAAFAGKYFFGDFVAGFIKVLDPATGQAGDFVTGAGMPVDLDVGADGALYYLDYRGSVGRVAFDRGAAGPTVAFTGLGENVRYSAGQAMAFGVVAKDAKGKRLPAARVSYRVDRVTGDGVEHVVPTTVGKLTGRFRTWAENDVGAVYRIAVTATDAAGASTTVTRDVAARLVNVRVKTSPVGGAVGVDGATPGSPLSFMAIAGSMHVADAVERVKRGEETLVFAQWAGRTRQSHLVFKVPVREVVLTAVYRVSPGRA